MKNRDEYESEQAEVEWSDAKEFEAMTYDFKILELQHVELL